MSGECSSCDTGSCYSSGLPSTISPAGPVSGPGIDYSSPTGAIYTDICDSGGLEAAMDMYGLKDIAEQIYLEHCSDPERVSELLKDASVNGVGNLPHGIAGVTNSAVQYDPTGKVIDSHSDILYDNTHLPEDQLYTLLHEYRHVEQIEYSANMPRSFSEGDAELNAQDIMDSYLENLDKLYDGTLCTSYTSDPTYNECKAFVADIYEAIGGGNATEGMDLFYNALDLYEGDFYKALDSFEQELAGNGLDLDGIYSALDMLNTELEAKMPGKGTVPETPYTDIISSGPINPAGLDIPYADIFGTADGAGCPVSGMPSPGYPIMPGVPDPVYGSYSIQTGIFDLLRKPEEVYEQYLKIISS
ncbi:MAG: hypothetical protein U9O53_05210 [archaeon]|nr:hypothetical protein [archaeon]